MPDLPQELIDAIIEEVPDSSLGACSLTATAFVLSSQRRIFRWMSLSNVPAYERAADLLASSPHLGKYVLSLALDVKEIPKDYTYLKSVLTLLSELERVSIVGDANAATRNQIGENPCLVEGLSLPTLRSFALHHLSDVPPAIITHALASFEEVSLSHLSIADEQVVQSEVADLERQISSQTDLWHLIIVMDAYESILPFVFHPKRLGYLKHLERLSLVFSPIPELLQPRFMELLSACSRTLEHLEIELEAPLDLPALPSLWFLELWSDINLIHRPELLTSIISETTASTPHLEVLTIAFLDRPNFFRRNYWEDTRPWPALDAALMDMKELCEVYLSLLHLGNREPERWAAFVPFIRDKLPRASEAGLLGFSYRPGFPHPMDRFA